MPSTIPTTINAKECTKHSHTYYTLGDDKFATAANWRREGLTPKAGAKAVTMVTSQGYEFSVYRADQTTAYDAEADAKTKAAIKELNAQMTAAQKRFMAGEITANQFNKFAANTAKQVAALRKQTA